MMRFETVEDFYRYRMKEGYMDPSQHPERRHCHNDQVGRIEFHDTKSQKEVFEHLEKICKVEEADMVNHPPHYNSRSMEAADIIEICLEGETNTAVAYPMSNVLKYILRFRGKNGVQDLEKSLWYFERMIQKYKDELEARGPEIG